MNREFATLAGGCFWGMEDLLRGLLGVINTTVGYTGGKIPNPTYEIVKTGLSGHAEAVLIEFDPIVLNYGELLRFFFRIHDPTTLNRQMNDIGSQYRSAIFYHSSEQLLTAERIIKEIDAKKFWQGPIVTQLISATTFYPAEEYHQDYLQKNPGGYTCHWIRD